MSKFIYYTRLSDEPTAKGVKHKITNTVNAIKKEGFDAELIQVSNPGLYGHLIMFYKIISSNADVIVYRATPFSMFFIFYALIYLRLKGKKIIIDIPTPISILVQEVNKAGGNILIKKIKIILLYITIPFSFLPANRILQYSHESKWFSLGMKKKTKLVGNGISVNDIPFYKERKNDTKTLNLICISGLGFWHGYDRLIKSLYQYKVERGTLPFNFFIIGEGPEKDNLLSLVKKLEIEENIFFEGYKSGKELDLLMEKMDIAISSLCLFKKDLYCASELKVREYTARGIPFVLACEDFDFPDKLDFVYDVINNESIIDLEKIKHWYINLQNKYQDFSYIREYAYKHLDMQKKVKVNIISILEEK